MAGSTNRNTIQNFIRHHWVLLGCILFLILIKIPHLPLPMSWDEAWSYYPAVLKMVENGPSIITGAIPIYESKGHPLLFYFLQSAWITLFSDQIRVTRILPLIVSVLTIIALFILVKIHFSRKTANITIAVFSVQSIFLAQATLVLPEVLLTLFLILSVRFFLSEKFGFYALFSSLMVLTKETGLIFAAVFGFFYVFENVRRLRTKRFWFTCALLLIPLVIFLVHLILNYIAFNTFFFSEHLELVTFNKDELVRILKSSTSVIFTRYGRNVILIAGMLSYLSIRIAKVKMQHLKIHLLFLILCIVLIAFSSINFYTYRYMLPVLPFFILACTDAFCQASSKHKVILTAGVLLMIIVPLQATLTSRGKYDVDFGYEEYLPLHKNMVEYCEQEFKKDKLIASEFNMVLALRDPFTGYLSTGHGFRMQHLPDLKDAEIVILDSTGQLKSLPENEMENFVLVKRFETKKHWGEVYQRKVLQN